jgi:two-component system sensor histidine kinase RegB
MEFFKTSKNNSLKKSTYIYLRWTAYFGQLSAILFVRFFFEFEFNYIPCILIIIFSILTNLYLEFGYKENQLSNFYSSTYLAYDIIQLSALFYLTGGITNPFIFIIIIPAVFSSQYLSLKSSVILVILTIIFLIILSFHYYELPHPKKVHFHVPDYYLYSIPISIFIGLIYLVYFGVKFGKESRIRKEAYDKIQEMLAKENELLSLGAQAAAAAHSLGTPLSTILLTANELKKDYDNNEKINKDLELLVSQATRCREILKKLTLNPNINDKFLEENLSISDYIHEIVRSYEEISSKDFIINLENYKNPIKTLKSAELIYGLRNFIGNANKFSIKKVKIFLKSNNKNTEVIIIDDGPGFPKDLIDSHKLGEPYIRSTQKSHISKYGLGLGTFIGKTLLEKNFAKIKFENMKQDSGAKVAISWLNSDLNKV